MKNMTSVTLPAKEAPVESSFGLARLKKEGCAVHPDDILGDMSPEYEQKQLRAYHRDHCEGGHWIPWSLSKLRCQRCGLEKDKND